LGELGAQQGNHAFGIEQPMSEMTAIGCQDQRAARHLARDIDAQSGEMAPHPCDHRRSV